MKICKLFFVSLVVLSSCGKSLILTEGNHSNYVIIVSSEAGENEMKAANEFQRLLMMCSMVKLPIMKDDQKSSSYEIIIGNTNRGIHKEVGDLHLDGFTIQSNTKKLFIKGGTDKGCLYGVYTFFETYLHFRCYSPSVFKYPAFDRITLPTGIVDTQVPFNLYRNTYYEVTNDAFYADWHKLKTLNSRSWSSSEWGMFVHTFNRLVPYNMYFNDHPEYFAMVDGKRGKELSNYLPRYRPQLCLTNPDVERIVVENLEAMIKENPEALYWSVSQGDTDETYFLNCTCDACAALDSESESPSGSIIHFINKVAEHFPDKIISTLAYRYSRTPPKAVIPAPNVNIMLCTIECDRHIPIENDTSVASFHSDLEGWSQLTGNILMWDYVVQFHNLLAPFPNLRVLQPNLQYFARNGVNANFQQGNISKGGEFCELRPYLIAKLLWNPDIDLQSVMNDFLEGYYEEAAPYIAHYINLMHDELEKSGLKLIIYGNPADHAQDGFLSRELMDQYELFFDQAENAVLDKPDVLERVKTARLPLTYSLFEISKRNGVEETRVFTKNDGIISIRPEILNRLDDFQQLCKTNGLQTMREGRWPPDEYCENLKSFLISVTNQRLPE